MKEFKLPKLFQIQNGQVLITLVIVIPAMVLIVSAYLSLSNSNYRLERRDQFRTQAQMAADAGADYAVEQVNQDNSWSGTGGEITLQSDATKKVTYTVVLTNNGSTSKTLNITGRTYFPASASTASATVKINVDLQPVSSGSYSIVSGAGGLVMSNSSKIVAGDILINGTINMLNSAQIGLTTNAVNVNVADAACPIPADSTYPRICNSGEAAQPISIANTAHIYGTVKANNQTSGTNMSNPGLTAGSGVSVQPLPTYDRAGQKAAVATTITGASAGCSSGTKTWAANTKITGDVTVSGSCKVTVAGKIWITGALALKNTSQLIVSNALGTTVPVIMVDGAAGAALTQCSQLASNSSGTGFELITFWANSACSPDCSSLTGTGLANSRATTTISLAQTSAGPQTIFYAYWSQVDIGNSGQIGALVGQTINMHNTGTITFGTSVQTGTTFWTINGYRRAFN
jgi:hypothetical protein